ncbi:transmembrane protein 160-like [Polyodon spathula]|uniref:transmembrane protein 160-like n=1 Tax=Polyodon spathula TaxID=7913 RepID=UPI001B7DC80B|nr:transmembrane protein 160-like [Polyodon spathula]
MATASWLGLRLLPRLGSQQCQGIGLLHTGLSVGLSAPGSRKKGMEPGARVRTQSRRTSPSSTMLLLWLHISLLSLFYEILCLLHIKTTLKLHLNAGKIELWYPWISRAVGEQLYAQSVSNANPLYESTLVLFCFWLGFLSCFRNGLLATGIGVISYVQSNVGCEAAYGFFILGGMCGSFGSTSYIGNLFVVRHTMLLSLPAVLLNSLVVSPAALFWLCAVALYIGRLQVEIMHNREEGCEDCRKDEEDRGKKGK